MKIITTDLMRVRKLIFVLRPLQFFSSTQKEGSQPLSEEAKAHPCQFCLQTQGGKARQVSLGPGRLQERY